MVRPIGGPRKPNRFWPINRMPARRGTPRPVPPVSPVEPSPRQREPQRKKTNWWELIRSIFRKKPKKPQTPPEQGRQGIDFKA